MHFHVSVLRFFFSSLSFFLSFFFCFSFSASFSSTFTFSFFSQRQATNTDLPLLVPGAQLLEGTNPGDPRHGAGTEARGRPGCGPSGLRGWREKWCHRMKGVWGQGCRQTAAVDVRSGICVVLVLTLVPVLMLVLGLYSWAS